MRILFLDSVGRGEGLAAPAYFSRHLIRYLQERGHEAAIADNFDPATAVDYDFVISEWCNEVAYAAAASGLCKRLVIRMRGYDVHGPLARMEWSNVDALVYESRFLQRLAEEAAPALRDFVTPVIPSGVDLRAIPFVSREQPKKPVLALVARATADKGYQLALEFARGYRGIQLHVTTAQGESNPRLIRYLRHAKPPNVAIHGAVDTIPWLQEIGATHILSTSIWETLGYSIAEGMAMGLKPLVHDAPGTSDNWPREFLWSSLKDLADLIQYGAYTPDAYRLFVEQNLDAGWCSGEFLALLQAIEERPARTTSRTPPSIGAHAVRVEQALHAGDLAAAEALVTDLRQRVAIGSGVADIRAGLTLWLAAALAQAGEDERAAVWALRCLNDGAQPDAMCLLGEIAHSQGDIDNAVRWYRAAVAMDDVPSKYRLLPLANAKRDRLEELQDEVEPLLTLDEPPTRYLIVVAARNAEPWIGECLGSIRTQYPQSLWHCVMVDDASTDGTAERMRQYAKSEHFTFMECLERRGSLRNIVSAINAHAREGDVIVIVDGDDKLISSQVICELDSVYRDGAWATYGNFVTTDGSPSWMAPYARNIVRANAYRRSMWQVSHPKTFRYKLFKHIKHEDFMHEGQWFTTAGDVALMLPILEMAQERAVYIPKPLYVYNTVTPLADHRLDPDGQVRARDLIYAKKSYTRLEKL